MTILPRLRGLGCNPESSCILILQFIRKGYHSTQSKLHYHRKSVLVNRPAMIVDSSLWFGGQQQIERMGTSRKEGPIISYSETGNWIMSSLPSGRPPSLKTMASLLRLRTTCSSAVRSRGLLVVMCLEPAVSSPSTIHTSLSVSSWSFSSIMLPMRPYLRSCLAPSGCVESVLKIALMTASSDHHVLIRMTTSWRRDGSERAHGNGYFASHRVITPASKAAGIFSCNMIFNTFKALFSPRGLVFGRMGDTVVEVSSTCSSRKWQRQLTIAV